MIDDKHRLSITMLIGIFFGVFALSLFAAMFFTQSERGRIVNLICSIIFMLISIGAIIFSKLKK